MKCFSRTGSPRPNKAMPAPRQYILIWLTAQRGAAAPDLSIALECTGMVLTRLCLAVGAQIFQKHHLYKELMKLIWSSSNWICLVWKVLRGTARVFGTPLEPPNSRITKIKADFCIWVPFGGPTIDHQIILQYSISNRITIYCDVSKSQLQNESHDVCNDTNRNPQTSNMQNSNRNPKDAQHHLNPDGPRSARDDVCWTRFVARYVFVANHMYSSNTLTSTYVSNSIYCTPKNSL